MATLQRTRSVDIAGVQGDKENDKFKTRLTRGKLSGVDPKLPAVRQPLRGIGNRVNAKNVDDAAKGIQLPGQKPTAVQDQKNRTMSTSQADVSQNSSTVSTISNNTSRLTKPPVRKPVAVPSTRFSNLARPPLRAQSFSTNDSSRIATALPRQQSIATVGPAVKPLAKIKQGLGKENIKPHELRATASELPTVQQDAMITATVPPSIAASSSTAVSYSSGLIPLGVCDVDTADGDNPLLVSEYVNEIYEYMRQLEKQQAVRENYLRKGKVTGKMRAVLVDWLYQVHLRFKLLPETIQMTVAVLDRFLQEVMVPKEQLQLVGVVAMWLSCKYEEIYAPEINDFVYITDGAFTKEQIRSMEQLMLRTLNFNLGRPLPLHYLRRYSKAMDAEAEHHSLAKYLTDLALTEYSLVHISPSLLAAAATWLARTLLGDEEWAVREKFALTKFYEVSKLPCLTSDRVFHLAGQPKK